MANLNNFFYKITKIIFHLIKSNCIHFLSRQIILILQFYLEFLNNQINCCISSLHVSKLLRENSLTDMYFNIDTALAT